MGKCLVSCVENRNNLRSWNSEEIVKEKKYLDAGKELVGTGSSVVPTYLLIFIKNIFKLFLFTAVILYL